MRRGERETEGPVMLTESKVEGRDWLTQMEELVKEHPPVAARHHSMVDVLKVMMLPRRGEARDSSRGSSSLIITSSEEGREVERKMRGRGKIQLKSQFTTLPTQ